MISNNQSLWSQKSKINSSSLNTVGYSSNPQKIPNKQHFQMKLNQSRTNLFHFIKDSF